MARVIDLEAVQRAPLSIDPYPYFLGRNFLKPDTIDALRESFPPIDRPGFLTVDEVQPRGAFRALIEELEGEELCDTLSRKFGFDLHPYPRLTTVRRLSHAKDGRPHTDGDSKVMTLLVYMNDTWTESGEGRLRVLYGDKGFEPFAVEVPPVMGTVFAFLRSDHSWHGHLPFTGERRVVQVAWLADDEEIQRKKSQNKTAQLFKRIFGR